MHNFYRLVKTFAGFVNTCISLEKIKLSDYEIKYMFSINVRATAQTYARQVVLFQIIIIVMIL